MKYQMVQRCYEIIKFHDRNNERELSMAAPLFVEADGLL